MSKETSSIKDHFIYEVVLTPALEGGFDVSVPDLPGCYSYGCDTIEAVANIADAMKTYVSSMLLHGDRPPHATRITRDGQTEVIAVYFETDASYVLPGEKVSAAEASRLLGVSASRVTHMIDSGILDGYREGRRTWVTLESVNRRLEQNPRPGRPKLLQAEA